MAYKIHSNNVATGYNKNINRKELYDFYYTAITLTTGYKSTYNSPSKKFRLEQPPGDIDRTTASTSAFSQARTIFDGERGVIFFLGVQIVVVSSFCRFMLQAPGFNINIKWTWIMWTIIFIHWHALNTIPQCTYIKVIPHAQVIGPKSMITEPEYIDFRIRIVYLLAGLITRQ